jgi:outer membrane protein TolC
MKVALSFIFFFLHTYLHSPGQDNPGNGNRLTLLQDIQRGEKNYPLLKSKSYEVDASRKNIDLNKNSFVPNLDFSYQANLATANNITGMFYPPDMIPMTGPVFSSNNYNPGFGTAASLFLNWQPYTFGQRSAQIKVSKAGLQAKVADWENEIFKHTINVISTYLDVLLATELVRVNAQNVERTSFDLKQSRVLAITGLRPGVDTALFLSELAKAKIDLLNSRKFLLTQQILLSELLVSDSSFALTDTLFFTKLPSVTITKEISTYQHPLLKFSQSELDLSKSRENLLKRSWVPKLEIWGTGFARGSGIYPDGMIKAADGWGFSRYNYALGFQLVFPILHYSEVRLQKGQKNFIIQSGEELLKHTSLQLSKQQAIGDANLLNALEVARETPTQFESAEYAFRALQIRYNTGLVNFADLIQAQYGLVRAETELKKSYWEAWKALLFKTAVTGDLNLFLNESR